MIQRSVTVCIRKVEIDLVQTLLVPRMAKLWVAKAASKDVVRNGLWGPLKIFLNFFRVDVDWHVSRPSCG